MCNNAELPKLTEDDKTIGDPMEIALLEVGRKAGMERADLRDRLPEVREVAFDPDIKMMATIHEADEGYWVAVKGAPEAVLEKCTHSWSAEGQQPLESENRDRWQQRLTETAEAGLRVLAFATKTVDSSEASPYENLTFFRRGWAGRSPSRRGERGYSGLSSGRGTGHYGDGRSTHHRP